MTDKTDFADIAAKEVADRQADPYSFSKLREWLDYDKWDMKEALCLICNIEPNGAKIHWTGFHNYDRVRINLPKILNCALLSENDFFYTVPFEDDGNPNFDHYLHPPLPELHWDGPPDVLLDKKRKLWEAEEKLRFVWNAFHRKSGERDHNFFASETPYYFLAWAKENAIDIPWLLWAEERDLIKRPSKPEAETQAVDDAPELITPSDKRRDEGLRAAKTILIQKRSIGKLHNKLDFKKCMIKAAVIKYIREHPATFPHCADTAPVLGGNQSSVVARREPTLAKDFPDFTKHPEILAEYEKLISEE